MVRVPAAGERERNERRHLKQYSRERIDALDDEMLER